MPKPQVEFSDSFVEKLEDLRFRISEYCDLVSNANYEEIDSGGPPETHFSLEHDGAPVFVSPPVDVTSEEMDEFELGVVIPKGDSPEPCLPASSTLDSSFHHQFAISVASGEQCEHAVQLVPKKRELERRDVGPLDVIMEDEEFEEEIVPTEETILPVEETIELCTESRSSGSDFEVQVKVLLEHDEEWENVASSRIEWARRLRQNRTVDSESLLSHPVSDSVSCIKLNGFSLVNSQPVVYYEDVKTSVVTNYPQKVNISQEKNQEDTRAEVLQKPNAINGNWIVPLLNFGLHLLFLLLYAWSCVTGLIEPELLSSRSRKSPAVRKKRRVSFNVLFRFKNVEGGLNDPSIPRKLIRSTLKMDGCLGDSGASEDDEDASQSLQKNISLSSAGVLVCDRVDGEPQMNVNGGESRISRSYDLHF